MSILGVLQGFDELEIKRDQAQKNDKTTSPFAGSSNASSGEGETMSADEEDAAVENSFVNKSAWNESLTPYQRMSGVLGEEAVGGMFGKPFAIGGDLQTHGSDWSTGLTHVNAGGSHEESPYDGVQIGVDPEGVPNLVEEGETVYNDYVFSNRILADEATKRMFHLPKRKDITFADISKKFEKEIAERPNDPISKAGFKAQMQQLEEQQERQKQEMEAEKAKAAFEALSPEEQTALMQRAAQEEQMAQQAAEQQAIAEQQAAIQPSPEEAAMMQQQADGTQAMVGQQPQEMAEGGHLFPWGGLEELFGIKPPYAASNTEGYIPYTRDLTEEEVLKREEDPVFKAWTDYVNNNWDSEEVQNYLRNLDKAAGGNHLFDKEGKILDKAKDYFNHARTRNHKWGYYHLTPTQLGEAKELTEVNPDVPTPRSRKATPAGISTDASGLKPDDSAVRRPETVPTKASTRTASPEEVKADKYKPNLYKETSFGMLGPAVNLGLMTAGVGKPDLSGVYSAATSASSAPSRAGYRTIGNYLTYKPMDRLFYANQLNGQSLATQRALMNTNSPSSAANLLAHAYNTMLANGTLYRQGEEYNTAQEQKVEDFNRGTNMFNAEAYNKASMFNAGEENRAKQFAAQMQMAAAKEKMDADAQWYNSLYGNINGIFDRINQYEKWKRDHNTMARMWASGIGGGGSSNTPVMQPYVNPNAKGGKVKKRKGKRGLTY